MRAVLMVAFGLVFPAISRAQSSIPVRRTLTNNYGPYSVYGPGLTYRQSSFSAGTSPTSVRVQTSVSVPDGGEALVGGFSSFSEGRNEAGAPLIGKAPYLNRGSKNIGYGRSIRNTSVPVRVRVIRMAEEEERQTGLRP
jgi:hypothetical protein